MYDNKYKQDFTDEELNKEVWKDIQGYKGLYKVSNLGRVKHLPYEYMFNNTKIIKKEHMLKPYRNNCGYMLVSLSNHRRTKQFFIHRLVASAFIPNPNNLPEVNHKDEDKTNNKVDNLEWCTRKYNMNYGTRIERALKTRKDNYSNRLIKEYKTPKAKKKEEKVLAKKNKKVIMRDIYGYKLREFNTLKEATFYLNKYLQGISNIRSCINGKIYTAYGYIWEYK